MNLGGRLKRARKARGLRQEELAERVPGSSQAMISALEVRDSETTHLLFEFADALQVSPRWLLAGKGASGLDGPIKPERNDPTLLQVIEIYRELSYQSRDQIVGMANRLHHTEHPEAPEASPLPAKPPLPARTGTK